jgi:hypothetical protein
MQGRQHLAVYSGLHSHANYAAPGLAVVAGEISNGQVVTMLGTGLERLVVQALLICALCSGLSSVPHAHAAHCLVMPQDAMYFVDRTASGGPVFMPSNTNVLPVPGAFPDDYEVRFWYSRHVHAPLPHVWLT